MIKYVKTSIFDSPAQTLVNPVNCVGVMGAGLALEFKKRYPEMFDLYKFRCRTGHVAIGQLDLHEGKDKWILNFPTKYRYDDNSKYHYLFAGLDAVNHTVKDYGITSIAFPKLGCGLGGLDWTVVKAIMTEYLSALDIPVYIHV